MKRTQSLCGWIATGMVTLTATLWTFWGAAEMYYEGWGNPFPEPLAYMIPGTICLVLTLAVLTWPRFGGWLLIMVGGAFTVWWWLMQTQRQGGLSLVAILSMFPVSGLLVLTGVLFLLEGRYRNRRPAEGWTPHPRWWLRNLHYLIGIGVPLLVLLAVSATQLPVVLTRVDDGDRGQQTIEGNGVTLVWAPAGPGWNWRQVGGWNPSWNLIALYGTSPVGLIAKLGEDAHATAADMRTTDLCRYLSADGLKILDEPQDVWRMPTTDEIVRSLVRRGTHAGCTWSGEEGRAACQVQPDKDMPLWASDQSAIYYWTADEYDEDEAWYVSYNGWVRHQPKDWGNPRHGHRCVRNP